MAWCCWMNYSINKQPSQQPCGQHSLHRAAAWPTLPIENTLLCINWSKTSEKKKVKFVCQPSFLFVEINANLPNYRILFPQAPKQQLLLMLCWPIWNDNNNSGGWARHSCSRLIYEERRRERLMSRTAGRSIVASVARYSAAPTPAPARPTNTRRPQA